MHTLPTLPQARTRSPRPRLPDQAASTAGAQFDADLRRHQSRVRWIHERLFFRPLLESFTAGGGGQLLSPEAAAERLQAFGFADADRTFQAVRG